jgi:hypothetical protein
MVMDIAITLPIKKPLFGAGGDERYRLDKERIHPSGRGAPRRDVFRAA